MNKISTLGFGIVLSMSVSSIALANEPAITGEYQLGNITPGLSETLDNAAKTYTQTQLELNTTQVRNSNTNTNTRFSRQSTLHNSQPQNTQPEYQVIRSGIRLHPLAPAYARTF